MPDAVNIPAEKTVWIIIPGLGEPRIPDKLTWLRENVARIAASRGAWHVRMRIYCYAQEILPASALPDEPSVPLEIVYEKGIVFQYLYKHVSPAAVAAQAAYVFFLLDDIRLGPEFSLEKFLQLYDRVQCDLLAASLTCSSPTPWHFMRQDQETLRKGCDGRRTNFVEFFATLMSAAAYRRYYSACLTDQTAWGWGIDVMLASLGFRLFLWDACPVAHMITSAAYHHRPDQNALEELKATTARLAAKGGAQIARWIIHEYL